MVRTRIKICGITSAKDAQAAIDAGADAIGLVFYDPSPRAVTIEQATEICAQLPPFITIVALTVDASVDFITQILDRVPVDLLQFHGSESPSFCEQFDRPYIKALRMKPGLNLPALYHDYESARAILLDAYRKGVPGGTGEQFDWQRIPAGLTKPLILAGGLTVDNIALAIKNVNPFAVDVSGGVEAEQGIKDHQKINELIKNVILADQAEQK